MKKLLLITGFFSLFIFSFCEGQSWDWGRQGNIIGVKPVVTCFVATDTHGNAFITGYFFPSIVFGPDTLMDSAIADQHETYFTKYNSTGTVQWAQQFTSPGAYNSPYGITEDASNNEIIAGTFNTSITIGSFNLNAYNNDLFLAKFDNNGNALWVIAGVDTNTGNATPLAVTTDKLKNIYITGVFSGNVNFGNTTLVGTDSAGEVFTAKYDSNGNVLWAKQGINITHVINYTQSNAISSDAKDYIIITGSYTDSIAFGNDTLISPILSNNQLGNLFVVKYDSAGSVVWAKQTVIPSSHSDAQGFAVTTDNAENIYLAGAFSDTASFGTYSLTEASLFHQAIFLTKYNSNGSVIWAKHANSDDYQSSSLLSDENNNVYMSGGGSGDSITFGTYTLHSTLHNGENSFLIKFDTSGNAVCGSMLKNGCSNTNYYNYSATDKSGTYIYEVGVFFNDSIFCGPDTLITYGQNPYVARWQNCDIETSTPQVQSSTHSLSLFPNPNNGQFTIQSSVVSGHSTIEIYNVLGEKVYSEILHSTQDDNRIEFKQPSGMYLYRVISENGQLIGDGKFIIE